MSNVMRARHPHPILDAHVHLWDEQRFTIPWFRTSPGLPPTADLALYRSDSRDVSVDGIVLVEAALSLTNALAEAHYFRAAAATSSLVRAIVASVALEDGRRARGHLDALREFGPLVRGVRRILQWETDPSFLTSEGLIEGLRLLPKYGLSFDICVFHYQLAGVITMVERCPETSFVLDHMGKPDVRRRSVDPWREHIRALARFPNVACKVSGIVTEADPEHWSTNDLAPYVRQVIESFGPDRLMFGGDWPVLRAASSYDRWVNTLDSLTVDLDERGRDALWHGTAERWYGGA